MSSGDLLFVLYPEDNSPPDTNPATPDRFAAATGFRDCLDFVGSGGSADEVAIFKVTYPEWYDGGGIDIVNDYSTDGTSVGAVEWELSAETLKDQDDQDAGGEDFGTVTNIVDTPSTATANIRDRTAAGSITHSNLGSPAKGDDGRIKLARDHDHATNTDDAQFHRLYVVES